MDFFVSMFGAYKKFLRSNKPGEAFDFDGFLKSKPSKEQPVSDRKNMLCNNVVFQRIQKFSNV